MPQKQTSEENNENLELEKYATGEIANSEIAAKEFAKFGFKVGDRVEVAGSLMEPYEGTIEYFEVEEVGARSVSYRAYVKVKGAEDLYYFTLQAIKHPSSAIRVTKI